MPSNSTMRGIMKKTPIQQIANVYQEFFNFMNQEHDLILTIEEMDEILWEARILDKKLNEHEFFDEAGEGWYANE